MPDTLMIPKTAANAAPLAHKDYARNLLYRAAETETIARPRLEEIRKALHQAAAERAAAYTAGRSTTVTRKQAEAFYISVLCQLDTVLLMLHSDVQAEEALRTLPLPALLEKGQLLTLHLYEEAKEHFRQAYQLTKPVQTAFFSALLKDFAQFCTKYDARFRANETKVSFSYPLLAEEPITENGVLGVHRYYTSLLREGELLHRFPAENIQALMARYADAFLTTPDMIAENIAELVLRHWMIRALCGDFSYKTDVTAEMLETVQTKFSISPKEELESALHAVLMQSELAQAAELLTYLQQALPPLAAAMHSRITAGRLSGWMAPL